MFQLHEQGTATDPAGQQPGPWQLAGPCVHLISIGTPHDAQQSGRDPFRVKGNHRRTRARRLAKELSEEDRKRALRFADELDAQADELERRLNE